MTTAVIREKLTEYLRVADDKKVKAIYTMEEDEIAMVADDWDDDFVAELNRRSASFADGTAKTFSWQETKDTARKI